MDRTRSDSASTSAVTNIRQSWYRYGSGTWILSSSTTDRAFLESINRSMTDVVIPGFRRRVANGELFFNSMNSLIYSSSFKSTQEFISNESTASDYHYRYLRSGSPVDQLTLSSYYNSFVAPNTNFLTYDSSSAQSAAILAAQANVSIAAAGVLETIAEFRETLETLRSLITGKVLTSLWAYRSKVGRILRSRGVGGVLKDALDGMSSEWLGYRYGIRPIVYDARNILSALNDKISSRCTARSASSVIKSDDSTTLETVTSPTTIKQYARRTRDVSVSIRAGILFDVDRGAAENLALRLGADHILETAWELVPYSFVVDWFINVGNYIAAWTPDIGCTRRGSWIAVKETSRKVLAVSPVGPSSSNWIMTGGVQVYTRTRVVKTRTPNPSVPTLPALSMRLDMSKWADLVTLFRQLRA